MPELTNKDALLERMVEQTTIMKNKIQNMAPVGCVQAFAGNTTPDGWLLCDGSAVSRTNYASLYEVIGTTYGEGDGSTTFNLPDLADKFIQGNETSGTEKEAGAPNITGEMGMRPWYSGSSYGSANVLPINGAFDWGSGGDNQVIGFAPSQSSAKATSITLDASRSSSVYGKSSTVQPPAVTMRYIIKY